jgi:hypothetical protein
MRTTVTRGARRLLVATGALTLGLAAVAPTAVAANTAPGQQEERKTWICHRTASETNPWVINHVAVASLPAHLANGDLELDDDGLAALEGLASDTGLDLTKPASWNQLDDDQILALLDDTCHRLAGGEENPGGGNGNDENPARATTRTPARATTRTPARATTRTPARATTRTPATAARPRATAAPSPAPAG